MYPREFSPSIERRQQNPYGSLVAAVLFRSFADAVAAAAGDASRTQRSTTPSGMTQLERSGCAMPSYRQPGRCDVA